MHAMTPAGYFEMWIHVSMPLVTITVKMAAQMKDNKGNSDIWTGFGETEYIYYKVCYQERM